VKVALVTTSPSIRSGIADYTRHLLPYLRELCEVHVYAEPEAPAGELLGAPLDPLPSLDARAHDRLLFQLGNERAHAFMPRAIKALGGTVMLHDWVLFDLACAAHPGLLRGGLKGHALALREGGSEQARRYARNWLDRRRSRERRFEPNGYESLPGALLTGWHEAEREGRWTSDVACLRIPAAGVREVEVALRLDKPRRARLVQGGQTLANAPQGPLRAELKAPDHPLLQIETEGIAVTRAQRSHGDSRRLGSFVQAIRWLDERGWHALDLRQPAARPLEQVHLSRDRFELPLNRSVVRHADSFLVHSRYVADRILAERNARTPLGVVHHGAERRWSDEDRRAVRRRLGLPAEWIAGFLAVSFGGVQAHKRIDQLLAGVAAARRERPDVHLVLAGESQAGGFDAQACARALGLGGAVRFTGFVPEAEGWDWIRAADVCVNLRGPTTGGTSGGIFQAFSNGRTVIASDAAEQRELPDCVLRVPLGAGEVEALARALVDLRDHPQRRDALEAGVRAFVERECHWSVVARSYAEHLQDFPGPRTSRRARIAFGSLWGGQRPARSARAT
jgi:glycosyltransferase involved in cell wall biosynthesis